MNTQRRRWQIRLRTIFVIITLLVVLLGAYDFVSRPYRAQRRAKAHLESLGAVVVSEPAKPRWLRHIVGNEIFEAVVELEIEHVTDADLVALSRLPNLRQLNIYAREVTDKSMPVIGSLPRLQELNILKSAVTDAGLKHLCGHPTLRKIWLPHLVTGRGVAHLRDCKELHTVTGHDLALSELVALKDAPIRDFGALNGAQDWRLLRHFPHLHRIRALDAGEDVKQMFARLSDMRDLREVGALSSSIDDDAVALLVEIPKLKSVDLLRSRVSIHGLKKLLEMPSMRLIGIESSLIKPGDVIDPILNAPQIELCWILTPWNMTDQTEARVSRLTRKQMGRLELVEMVHTEDLSYLWLAPGSESWQRPSDFNIDQLRHRKTVMLSALEGDFDLRSLSSLKQMEHLIAPDMITDAGLQQLAELTQLKSLRIASSRITSSGIRSLAPLQNLRQIRLSGMWLSSDDEKWLRATFPKATVSLSGIQKQFGDFDGINLMDLSGFSQDAVSESITDAFGKLQSWPNPVYLTVSTKGQGQDFVPLVELPNVRGLHLDLTDLNIENVFKALSGKQSLRRLDIHGASVNDDYIAKLLLKL